MKKSSLLLMILFFSHLIIAAQSTAGIGEVLQIESKAADYKLYQTKLNGLNVELKALRNELAGNPKLRAMEQELDSMKKKRDTEISELKLGYRCSQCLVFKSEMEKKGENFEAHLKRVNGVPIPAGDPEITSKRKEWVEKIAMKIVQVANFKAKLEQGLTDKKAAIDKINDALTKICPELVSLSKTYEQKVVAEAKNLQVGWIDGAMGPAAAQQIMEDKIFLATGRVTFLENEHGQKQQELQVQLKKENDEKIDHLNKANILTEQKNQETAREAKLKLAEITDQLAVKKAEMIKLEATIKNSVTDSTNKELTAYAVKLKNDIILLEKQYQQTEKLYSDKINELAQILTKTKAEIWDLKTGFSKIQQQEIEQLKKQYDEKIAQVNNAKANYAKQLPALNARFISMADQAREKSDAYVRIILKENSRMAAATWPIQCGILTSANIKVNSNYSDASTCMELLRRRHRSSYNPGIDCVTESAGYKMVYQPFISGLNADEMKIIKASLSERWF